MALQARGSDHELDLASSDDFITVLGDALHARNAAGARSRVCYSTVSGIMSGHLFTRDAFLLALALHGHVPSPAKLRALWLHQLSNGLSNVATLSLEEYSAQAESITGGLDPANLPPAYLLTAADMFALEAPARRRPRRRCFFLVTVCYLFLGR